MKIILLAAVSMIALAGCSAQQVKADIETKVAHDVAVAISPAALPDLQKAHDVAVANGDAEGATCSQEVANFLKYLDTLQVPSLTGPVDAHGCSNIEYWNGNSCAPGAAAAFEQLRVGVTAAPVATPVVPPTLIKGCAVVVFDAKLQLADFLAKLGIDVAGFKSAGTLGAAKALRAVQAAHP